jgi:hypothetical protein
MLKIIQMSVGKSSYWAYDDTINDLTQVRIYKVYIQSKDKKSVIKIFIIAKYLMFSRGLEKLLNQNDELEVVGWATDVNQARPEIEKHHPAVIIIYDDTPDDRLSPNGSGLVSPPVIDILEANPGVKVVRLNVHNNHLQVCKMTRQEATSIADLINAIHT